MQSAERVSHLEVSDNYVYQRSILAYHKAAEMVSGHVLEIGTGAGYGVAVIAPMTASFITVDKTPPPAELAAGRSNVQFHCMKVPPLEGIASASMDYVISFQVIEHIKRDFETIAEIYRVLKPGGKLIISTPNKLSSLTRNPWHIREYTPDEFQNLLRSSFTIVDGYGVFGNGKVMSYYQRNRESVRRIEKLDILNLQKNLPRWILKTPYDILNRRNRRKLFKQDRATTSSISMDDYFFASVDDSCFDLFYIAQK